MEITNNNIYCGNAYELIKSVKDKSIDIIYTDIPYLISGGGGKKDGLGARITKSQTELGNKVCLEKTKQKIAELDKQLATITDPIEHERLRVIKNNYKNTLNLKKADIVDGIDYSILDDFVRIQPYIYIYIWCSKEQIYDLMNYYVGKHHCKFNILVWCKTNPIPACNNTWLPDIEYCLVFRQEKAMRYCDGIENKSKWFVSAINKADKDLYNHPTIKPLELVKRHLKHSVGENKEIVVLDPFMGSGTTCVACKEIGCKYIGFELDEKYYQIAKDRLNGINQKGEMNLFETDFDKEQEEYEQMSIFD